MIDEALLEVILLQVHERRLRMTGVRQEIEAVHQAVAMKHLADAPAHALVHDRLGAAQAIEDLEGTLGVADGARADADRVFLVEHHHRAPAHRQVNGRAQPHRPGADDDHGMMARRTVELRRTAIGKDGIGVRLHAPEVFPHCGCLPAGRAATNVRRPALQPSSVAHISLSRCAVQMRGSA